MINSKEADAPYGSNISATTGTEWSSPVPAGSNNGVDVELDPEYSSSKELVFFL